MEVSPPVRKRFDRVAICSVLGNPTDPKVWSAAPHNLAAAMERSGIVVERIDSGPSRMQLRFLALRYVLSGHGMPPSSEAVLRDAPSRRQSAARLQRSLEGRNVSDVIHTGILDLAPVPPKGKLKHYLYCDDDWTFSFPQRPDASRYSAASVSAFAQYDRQALANVEHVFTFSRVLRQYMMSHYGLAPTRVTAVGCGMGRIEPYAGPKDYESGRILFVAKHLFAQKGGVLLLEAFRLARLRLPHISLTIVGDSRSRSFVAGLAGVTVLDHLSWEELQSLYRDSALLAQPMLNDPWGQVYVEALASRTPVLGLRRNGLPEIVENGSHGFLVDSADAASIADALVDALGDPQRLSNMGQSGQSHVLQNYTWDQVARRIAFDDATTNSESPLSTATTARIAQ